MKKILAMILSIVLSVSIGMTSVSAVSTGHTESTFGKLYDEEGNLVATIVGEKIDIPTVHSAGGQGEITETYRFDVLSSIVNHEDSANGQDSYYCVTAYLTLTYKERQDEPSVYLLTNVSGSWTTPNDSRVTVTKAVLKYQCIGLGPDRLYSNNQNSQVNLNVDRRSFDIKTGFTSYIIDEAVGCMGANLTLSLLMGTTRTWTLKLEKYPILNSDIGK